MRRRRPSSRPLTRTLPRSTWTQAWRPLAIASSRARPSRTRRRRAIASVWIVTLPSRAVGRRDQPQLAALVLGVGERLLLVARGDAPLGGHEPDLEEVHRLASSTR